jgi:hypothetical protein
MDFSKVTQLVELPMVVAHLKLKMLHPQPQMEQYRQC